VWRWLQRYFTHLRSNPYGRPGRAGSPGTVRKAWFDTEMEAQIAGQKLCEAKQKKGYQTIL